MAGVVVLFAFVLPLVSCNAVIADSSGVTRRIARV